MFCHKITNYTLHKAIQKKCNTLQIKQGSKLQISIAY